MTHTHVLINIFFWLWAALSGALAKAHIPRLRCCDDGTSPRRTEIFLHFWGIILIPTNSHTHTRNDWTECKNSNLWTTGFEQVDEQCFEHFRGNFVIIIMVIIKKTLNLAASAFYGDRIRCCCINDNAGRRLRTFRVAITWHGAFPYLPSFSQLSDQSETEKFYVRAICLSSDIILWPFDVLQKAQ